MTKKEKHRSIDPLNIDKMAKVDLFQSLQQVAKGGKVGSLNKPIKKNNQESNSDGDPWLERLVQVVAQQPA